jgi:hypothetical protein
MSGSESYRRLVDDTWKIVRQDRISRDKDLDGASSSWSLPGNCFRIIVAILFLKRQRQLRV